MLNNQASLIKWKEEPDENVEVSLKEEEEVGLEFTEQEFDEGF